MTNHTMSPDFSWSCSDISNIKSILFLIINFSIQNSFASSNQSKIEAVKKIKENLIKTNSLSFLFKQMIGKKIEVGKCLAKYPKLMHCYYDNKEKKELISDGYTFAIFKKKSPLNF